MNIVSILQVAVRLAGPILLVAMGGLLAQKANIFNLALEGFMLVSCFTSVLGAYLLHDPWWGILFGMLASVLFILVYAVFILELRADPVICAIAIITLASGITRFLCEPVFGKSGRFELPASMAVPAVELGWLGRIPVLGTILNGQSVLIYVALIAPFVLHFVIYRTNFGLSLRAVGLNEEAAQAAGIRVKAVKYTALLLNGVFCGLGGAQLALSVYMFNMDMTDGRGFIALAAVVLANGQPLLVFLAAMLFGIADSIKVSLSKYAVSSYLLQTIPYLMAILAAVLPFLIRRAANSMKQKNAQKRLIGAYYEDRGQ